MLIRWTDLQIGDTLVVSKEALEQRGDESWAQEDYYRKSLFLIRRVRIRDDKEVMTVTIRDSKHERGDWEARLNTSDGSMVSCGDYPFFEVLALAEEGQ
jgi:CYTH domain-containing protein